MRSIEPQRADGAYPDEPAPALPSAADIDQVLKAAHREGFHNGYDEGLRAGQEAGQAAGHNLGLQRGLEEGVQEGHQRALDQAREAVTAERVRLRELLNGAAASLASMEADLSDALVDLAIDIARQIVRHDLRQSRTTAITVVTEMLSAMPLGHPILKIWLHPDDLDLVRVHLNDNMPHAAWHLTADPAITPGGCRAESAHGLIDATVQTRWHRVIASLGRESTWRTHCTPDEP